MKIWNDGPARVVLVAALSPGDSSPFGSGTRLGATFEELLGAPVATRYASAAILPAETLAMPRHVYGYEARWALAERSVIVVGREAASLLDVPEDPLMIWTYVDAKVVEWGPLPPVTVAPFPAPGRRSAWWLDPENVEVARQWLEEHAG